MRNDMEKKRSNGQSRPGPAGEQKNKVGTRKDFWDTIADDVAGGYGARNANHTIRNRDQEPNDNRRGDEEVS